MDEEEKQQNVQFLQQSLSSLIFHPVEYVKVLCQLGYEPIPAKLGKTIFGNPRFILPNVFQYIKHIQRTEGLASCFTGLLPTILGNLASATCSLKVVKALRMTWVDMNDPPNIINEDEPKKEEYKKYACREMTLHAVSVVISHPFRVVTIRMMASFIGKEEGYQSMFKAIGSIFRDNGLLGFYSGIVPRLIGDLTCIGASIFFAYFVNKHIVEAKDARGYTFPVCMFITSTVTYPFAVVSTCMAVNGSSMVAGNPPQMPKYSSWRACFSDLVARRQHKRGGSLFFRYLQT